MRASDLFVKCLEAEGVEYIFGIPGEENLELMDSLLDSSIRFIPTRHEQGAAFMADAYGRLTGKAGVCLSTLGPGATNLSTGIADATLDRSPMVAITAQTSLDTIHKESHQFIDIVQSLRPLTKWNIRVEDAHVVPEIVRKAFKLAEVERPGACHIELPENIAGEDVDGEPLPSGGGSTAPIPDENSLEKAANLIDMARMPVILAGNGVIRTRASQELLQFATRANIPVANTFMGKGVIPSDNPLSLHTIGLQMKDVVLCGFDRADLVIAIGYDLVEYAPSLWNPGGNKRIIHIDSTPAEVDFHYKSSIELVGDIKKTLNILSEMVRGGKEDRYPRLLREYILNELASGQDSDDFPLKPQRVLAEVRDVMGPEDILISDVGAHKIWIARIYPAFSPNTVIISNGFSSMGFALPASIAAKMILPEKRVMAACGDGGFLMNCQELETACRLNLPIVVLVFNDGGYGLIRWKQVGRFGRPSGVSFGNPDLVRFSESFGAVGYRVEAAGELGPILQEAFTSKVPVVIDVPVDYGENMRLTERMGRLVCPT